jgi:hypothetical protein
MANWKPDSFVGRMLRGARRVPSAIEGPESDPVGGPGDRSIAPRPRRVPAQDDETHDYVRLSDVARCVIRLFRAHYGPTVQTFAGLDAANRALLHERLLRLWTDHNLATDGTTRVEAEYLEVRVDVR